MRMVSDHVITSVLFRMLSVLEKRYRAI